jgi:hypothetical protein
MRLPRCQDLVASKFLFFLIASLVLLQQAKAQGCSNQCPPINAGQGEVMALCEGDQIGTFANVDKIYNICRPTSTSSGITSFALKEFIKPNHITVVANYYTGCNAGRRESGVFAHIAQRFYNMHGSRITFIQSVKGGGTCEQWASIYENDATDLYPDSNIVPKDMPLSVDDIYSELRDDLFTTPFGHPSYVIFDENGVIQHKFIGPCCGYESYFDCTADIAKELDTTMTEYLTALLGDTIDDTKSPTVQPLPTDAPTLSPFSANDCEVGEYSEWSECSITCGTSLGIQFRWRKVTTLNEGKKCPAPFETRECEPVQDSCVEDTFACIQEFGDVHSIETVASGFNSPRDVDFHPTPGLHLGNYSEGRTFYPEVGEEAWVVNGANHSVSIVASLGSEYQTTFSRRDRGYYHYMINGTALAFNHVADSGRTPDRDGFNYWAICNDNANTYVDTKEPNFFMGPTLYNSDPENYNVVNRLGEQCRDEEQCYFLHSDMLHEAPSCIGMAHDPEVQTTYGHVYWLFDTTGNRQNGQLVRFDFQQPHGPRSMDHSIAAVRRYVEVKLERGAEGVHAGMVVHPTRREIFIAVPGSNKIIAVAADSGSFARTAREEYPIFSNRLPSFEYSIWECVEQRVFAQYIDTPSGMALSKDGKRLFVAERGTGIIHVYEVDSGALLHSIPTGFDTIGGLAISPKSNEIFFVDDKTNSLNKAKMEAECTSPHQTRVNPQFTAEIERAELELGINVQLFKDYQCTVNPEIPDSSFFDQVHDDSGYADNNPDVQSDMVGMNEEAALLADRTDCGYTSELNFDALLLGGYFCHICLPEQHLNCDRGGICSNVQWQGYTCDNEFQVIISDDGIGFQDTEGNEVMVDEIVLRKDVIYRFTVLANDKDLGLCALLGDTSLCAKEGPLIVPIEKSFTELELFVEGKPMTSLILDVDEGNKTSTGIIIAIVVPIAVLVIAAGYFVVRRKGNNNKAFSRPEEAA